MSTNIYNGTGMEAGTRNYQVSIPSYRGSGDLIKVYPHNIQIRSCTLNVTGYALVCYIVITTETNHC